MPSTVAQMIEQHHAEILQLWLDEANKSASAKGLAGPEFSNAMPPYLSLLAQIDVHPERKLTALRRSLLERHVGARLRQGFALAEVVDEFALLGRCIFRIWTQVPPEERPAVEALERVLRDLHVVYSLVTQIFTDHLLHDEQSEKRYLRLIRQIAAEGLDRAGAKPFLKRLEDVLALVMDAMEAQSTALLLYEAEERTLRLAASVGIADEELKGYVTSLDAGSFAAKVASAEEPIEELNAATTELEVSDALRQSGIHSIIGIRLPPREDLLGVLYVGLSATRAFTGREVRRMEALADALSLHLDNARLYQELVDRVAELREEQQVRDRVVSLLAHDLRGPLTTVRFAAQALSRVPERRDVLRELSTKIESSVERLDRMIRSLLDAELIRSGKRLPLHLAQCDLVEITGDLFRDLTAIHGDRFVLAAPGHVRGFWGREELRRVLWNLCENAVKYGSPATPITVSLSADEGKARALVHNSGPPLSPQDQASLFDPFARTAEGIATGKNGWGLGLTFVRGCVEAHGGKASVQSEEGRGTTFAFELPLDARPFQPSEVRPDDKA